MTPSAARFNENDPVLKFGFGLMLLYFFLLYSRVLDLTIPFMRVPLILGSLLYLVTVASGTLPRTLATPIGKLLIVQTGLMVVSSIFGIWRGGSIHILTDFWFKAFPYYFIIVAFANTPDRCLKFIRFTAAGQAIMTMVALWRGDNVLGRLVIDGSRYGDPNDLALACVMALGLVVAATLSAPTRFIRLAGFAGLLPISLAFLKTGSRGGMIALAAMFLVAFWKASMGQR